MKLKISTYCILFTAIVLMAASCGGTEKTNENSQIEDETAELVADSEPVDLFNEFLGIDYGTEEHLVQNVLGKFTNGNYTSDSSAFIYYFNRADRVPISVWVSAETGKVITVFMEVLSLGKNFDDDLQNAKDEYGIRDADAAWFGLSPGEIKLKMGEPAEEAISADQVLLLSYDSKNYFITVAFKIYPQQENRCGSISVNWFY